MNLIKIIDAQRNGEDVLYQLVFRSIIDLEKYVIEEHGSVTFNQLCIPKNFYGNHLLKTCKKVEINSGERLILVDNRYVFFGATLYVHYGSKLFRLFKNEGFLLLPVPKRISRSLMGNVAKMKQYL